MGTSPRVGRVEAVVRGRVQGVGFRVFVAREARRRGLVGWVRNGSDGAVRIVVEGPDAQLDGLLEILHDGPPAAWVKGVEVVRGRAAGGFAEFEIQSGGHGGD
ncbi:MAG: acylphosphatase [Candidatus Limnocylindrales bacterium]|jgi:acylphosphatase